MPGRHGAAHQRLDARTGVDLLVDAVDDLRDEDVQADRVDETVEDLARAVTERIGHRTSIRRRLLPHTRDSAELSIFSRRSDRGTLSA